MTIRSCVGCVCLSKSFSIFLISQLFGCGTASPKDDDVIASIGEEIITLSGAGGEACQSGLHAVRSGLPMSAGTHPSHSSLLLIAQLPLLLLRYPCSTPGPICIALRNPYPLLSRCPSASSCRQMLPSGMSMNSLRLSQVAQGSLVLLTSGILRRRGCGPSWWGGRRGPVWCQRPRPEVRVVVQIRRRGHGQRLATWERSVRMMGDVENRGRG